MNKSDKILLFKVLLSLVTFATKWFEVEFGSLPNDMYSELSNEIKAHLVYMVTHE